ncbi:TIGR01777 family oxidoreductase [soil metagenome]
MKKEIFIAKSRFHATADEIFAWHEKPGAFDRLSPPWVNVKCVERSGGINDGSRVVLLLEKGPARMPWVLGHKDYVKGKQFVDFQIAGPFDYWQQSHVFEEDDPSHSYLTDRVEYSVPMGLAGKIAGAGFVRSELGRLFRYRHALMARDMALLKRYGQKHLKVLVSGATGLVGERLVALLLTQGHSVVKLSRRSRAIHEAIAPASPSINIEGGALTEIFWEPLAGTIESSLPDDLDAVVHLSGRNVSAARWTVEEKQLIYQSRVKSTQYLCQLLAAMPNKPEVLVCASAIGFYGDRGSEPLTEDASEGSGFLAEVCIDWELAASAAKAAGIRVVSARIGAVLSPKAGALAKLLPIFSAGAGGRIGDGKQYFSWVSIDDVCGAIYHSIVTKEVEGALNVVAPNCATNAEFTRAMGRALFRPTLFPVPPGVLRIAFGEMADALLMASVRVLPQKLKQTGYEFQDPDLLDAIKYLLGRGAGHK